MTDEEKKPFLEVEVTDCLWLDDGGVCYRLIVSYSFLGRKNLQGLNFELLSDSGSTI